MVVCRRRWWRAAEAGGGPCSSAALRSAPSAKASRVASPPVVLAEGACVTSDCGGANRRQAPVAIALCARAPLRISAPVLRKGGAAEAALIRELDGEIAALNTARDACNQVASRAKCSHLARSPSPSSARIASSTSGGGGAKRSTVSTAAAAAVPPEGATAAAP